MGEPDVLGVRQVLHEARHRGVDSTDRLPTCSPVKPATLASTPSRTPSSMLGSDSFSPTVRLLARHQLVEVAETRQRRGFE